jgi:hypothetical protein
MLLGVKTLAACVLFASVVGCGPSQPTTDPSALSSEEFERGSKAVEKPRQKAAEEPEEEVSSKDECDVECLSADDCCQGYYCGKHPERSQRKDYCLPH